MKTIAQDVGGPTGHHVADAAREAFVAGASERLPVAIVPAGLDALMALRYLPARTSDAGPAPADEACATAAA